MRGRHVIHLHNPENKAFDFCATGYIVAEDRFFPVAFEATGPEGQELARASGEFTHRSPPEPAAIAVPAGAVLASTRWPLMPTAGSAGASPACRRYWAAIRP